MNASPKLEAYLKRYGHRSLSSAISNLLDHVQRTDKTATLLDVTIEMLADLEEALRECQP